jgi:hypothetical protein
VGSIANVDFSLAKQDWAPFDQFIRLVRAQLVRTLGEGAEEIGSAGQVEWLELHRPVTDGDKQTSLQVRGASSSLM